MISALLLCSFPWAERKCSWLTNEWTIYEEEPVDNCFSVKKNNKKTNCLLVCLLSACVFLLPSSFLQAASLRQLEEENHEAAARLEEVVYRGDLLLEKIQSALADIAQSQLRTRSGTSSQPAAPEPWPPALYNGQHIMYTVGTFRSCVHLCSLRSACTVSHRCREFLIPVW